MTDEQERLLAVRQLQSRHMVERAARKAFNLLKMGGLSDYAQEEVRGCIVIVEQERERWPDRHPGMYEEALLKFMARNTSNEAGRTFA